MLNIKKGFTLVELIVVITILAILGTIAFLSLQGYSKNARNSVRVTDLGLLKKSLELVYVSRGTYPIPDEVVDVTYSGAVLWYQGYFGDNVFRSIERLSKKSVDPLFNIDYSYSVLKNSKQYQVGTIIEDNLLGLSINQANAVTNVNITSYVSGNFDFFDVMGTDGTNCFNVTTPSIIVNNLVVGGILTPGGNYNFIFNKSENLPSNYESSIGIIGSGQGFDISKVYNKCSVDTLVDFNTYISNLALSYQQYSFSSDFDQVVFYSDTLPFKLNAIDNLQKNGILVSDNIIDDIYLSADYNVFMDTFSGNDNDELISEHTPNSLGSWDFNNMTSSNSYIISGNTLTKGDNSTDSVFPSLTIVSPDTLVAFELFDFAGGNIKVYSRYTDSGNYYLLNMSTTGYEISKNVSGTQTSFTNISETISSGSVIKFVVFGNSIKLLIDNIEKENIIDNSISSVGNSVLEMTNINAKIDNYILLYK